MRENPKPAMSAVEIGAATGPAEKQESENGAWPGPGDSRSADALATATLLLTSRAIRLVHLRESAPGIDDIGWHVLLDLMVATSRGKTLTVEDLAATHALPTKIMARYVAYLASEGRIARHAAATGRVSLSLTPAGDALARPVLWKIGQEIGKL